VNGWVRVVWNVAIQHKAQAVYAWQQTPALISQSLGEGQQFGL
jgi:hypothetical protein